jgi:hypothetical protein
MATFSLAQTLAEMAPGLPPGFTPNQGIRSLFPTNWAGSITALTGYHFTYRSSLHAVGITCDFSLDVWGSGKYRFSGTANNADYINADYAIGFTFVYSSGGVSVGDIQHGSAGLRGSDNFTLTDSNDSARAWIRNNWTEAFAPGVSTDLQVTEDPTFGLGKLLLLVVEGIAFVGLIVVLLLSGHSWHRDPERPGVWQIEW